MTILLENKNLRFPKVTIIVLNWNGKQDTIECLHSIFALNYSSYNVIVVDNASTDNSIEDIKISYPNTVIIENNENIGFTGGFNVGIKKAIEENSDYILCLNNDTVLDKNFILELVKEGETNSNIGGLCPIEYDYNLPNKIVYAGGSIGIIVSKLYGYGEIDHGQYALVKETKMLCGSAMMIKKNAFLEVGLFDEDYFFGSEDKDLALRLIKNKFCLLFVPQAKLWHKRRGATGGKITPLTVYFSTRNSLLFVRKHGKIHEILIFLPYFFLFHIPTLLLKGRDKTEGIKSIILALKWHIRLKKCLNNSRMVENFKTKV
jgi:hypothetical protein